MADYDVVVNVSTHASRRGKKRLGWNAAQLAMRGIAALMDPERTDDHYVSGGRARSVWKDGIKFSFIEKPEGWLMTSVRKATPAG